MKTRLNKYKIPMGFSGDEQCFKKLDKIQGEYLMDRSSVLRVILHNITPSTFEKYFYQERKIEKNRKLIVKKMTQPKVLASKNRKK